MVFRGGKVYLAFFDTVKKEPKSIDFIGVIEQH